MNTDIQRRDDLLAKCREIATKAQRENREFGTARARTTRFASAHEMRDQRRSHERRRRA